MAKKLSAYAQKLKDPRWQKVRLQVMQRDCFSCSLCGDEESTLFVHHGFYQYGIEPWEYPLESLHTLCESCHKTADETREETKVRIGQMSMEAQEYLLGVIESLDRLNYGDFLNILLLFMNKRIQDRLLEEHRKRCGSLES